jgi:antitoxin StbD
MKAVLANCSASISELKRNPSALIDKAEGEPIAILNHNRPTAYLIPAEEDYQLGLLVNERQNEKIEAVEVDIDAI